MRLARRSLNVVAGCLLASCGSEEWGTRHQSSESQAVSTQIAEKEGAMALSPSQADYLARHSATRIALREILVEVPTFDRPAAERSRLIAQAPIIATGEFVMEEMRRLLPSRISVRPIQTVPDYTTRDLLPGSPVPVDAVSMPKGHVYLAVGSNEFKNDRVTGRPKARYLVELIGHPETLGSPPLVFRDYAPGDIPCADDFCGTPEDALGSIKGRLALISFLVSDDRNS